MINDDDTEYVRADEIERLHQRIYELEQRGEPVAWIQERSFPSNGNSLFLVSDAKAEDFTVPLYLAQPSPEDKP